MSRTFIPDESGTLLDRLSEGSVNDGFDPSPALRRHTWRPTLLLLSPNVSVHSRLTRLMTSRSNPVALQQRGTSADHFRRLPRSRHLPICAFPGAPTAARRAPGQSSEGSMSDAQFQYRADRRRGGPER